ncbi:Armadillo repeat-containing protein 1 [Takifugu flavidus]|uniref:Armadillo repeat-containing protein 1 n=1 Tax=Takifugu flavidus TaxID=433684 RepID=A0A5C6NYK3_9TELE|nr:Armadillo repeat-containing protein 1 [Takifugu flavidus]
MSAEMDALTVVNQLRDLAADPLNRRAIVEDQGCLPGLILFLDHPNPQVVYSALLAVRYLAECRANREKMKSELGMMLSLQNVIQKQKNPSRNINGFTAHSSGDVALKEVVCRLMKWENVVNGETFSFSGMNTSPGETKLLASEIYEILQAAGNEEAERAEGEASSCKRKAHFFLGSSNKRAKTVVLHIDGLDDPTRRSLCEEALLKIRGVISFTFQMAVKRCVVRIRSDLKADALGTAINSTKVMTAQQVVRTDDGQELMVPFQEDSAAVVEENTDIPDYLPEEESPSQEQDKAVTRIGSVTEGMGWLSTAANFLTRSFYW